MFRLLGFIFIAGIITVNSVIASPLHDAITREDRLAIDSLLKIAPNLLEQTNELNDPPLLHAVSHNKTAIALDLIDRGTNIEGTDHQGISPLHIAANLHNLTIVEYLLKKGANVRFADRVTGRTALHYAAESGDTTICALLLHYGASIDTTELTGLTPLMRAAASGKCDAFLYLIHHGARVTVGQDRSNGLFVLASGGGNLEIVDTLLARGFNPNFRSASLSYPIHNAVWMKKIEMVRHLSSKGARVTGIANRSGWSPMHTACFNNDTAMISLLLSLGATPLDTTLNESRTPLHIAAEQGHIATVQLLLDRGARINECDREGYTPLICAAQTGKAEMVELLLKTGAKQEVITGRNDVALVHPPLSAIFQAARISPLTTSVLLKYGADPNQITWSGYRPLYFAIFGDSLETVDLLLAAGAKVSVEDSTGATPMTLAIQQRKNTVVEKLLRAGADPKKCIRDGKTPLHLAALSGNKPIAELLLASGADPNQKDNVGKYPRDYACYYGHADVAGLLETNHAKSEEHFVASASTLLAKPLREKEAIIWYLAHSGWAIRTKNHFLIIDYWERDANHTNAGLVNGHIVPEELKSEPVAIFASHEHNDHLDRAIFNWQNVLPNATYYLGVDPGQLPEYRRQPEPLPQYVRLRPGVPLNEKGLSVYPIKSDIDQGVGFLIEVDGLKIFHTGDAVDTSRVTPSRFTQYVDTLKQRFGSVDLLFFPIRGCGFPDLEALKKGNDYAIAQLQPKAVFPMHAVDSEYELREYADNAKHRGVNANFVTVSNRGDRYIYRDMKIASIK